MFPPGTVPPGLNHPGSIPLGHYPTDQIPFLFPPPGFFYVPVIVSLVLPNMILGIPVWYIDLPTNIMPGQSRPYHALTPVQLIPTTLVAASLPAQPQQEPALVVKSYS